ncbi:MAG: YbhB/YbcL family Raf kinase inhibitor-like protein [Candidatus Contendobacter sp.]|nr:YbhB/YbcL family Raf kinase inhibitor-like protein [Candidatus Contendobacter sp.]
MKLTSSVLRDQQPIPVDYAFGIVDPEQHVALGPNTNPPLAWSDLPLGTRTLALICHDPDVPTRADDVNQEGRQVPADLPRMDFFHWILVDLPPEPAHILAGEFSQGITPGGKAGPAGPRGVRQGVNNYREWFAGDPAMAGDYFGYDGPCPPWNDSIIHHYLFTLYALDVDRVPVDGAFTGPEILVAIKNHVLDQARLTVVYSLNPAVPT